MLVMVSSMPHRKMRGFVKVLLILLHPIEDIQRKPRWHGNKVLFGQGWHSG